MGLHTMIGENRQLVTDEPVEFEKQLVEVQDCKRITDHFRGIYRKYPTFIKENWRMSTCSRLDLQTLGSQPIIMSKNLPDQWLHMHWHATFACPMWFTKKISIKILDFLFLEEGLLPLSPWGQNLCEGFLAWQSPYPIKKVLNVLSKK